MPLEASMFSRAKYQLNKVKNRQSRGLSQKKLTEREATLTRVVEIRGQKNDKKMDQRTTRLFGDYILEAKGILLKAQKHYKTERHHESGMNTYFQKCQKELKKIDLEYHKFEECLSHLSKLEVKDEDKRKIADLEKKFESFRESPTIIVRPKDKEPRIKRLDDEVPKYTGRRDGSRQESVKSDEGGYDSDQQSIDYDLQWDKQSPRPSLSGFSNSLHNDSPRKLVSWI